MMEKLREASESVTTSAEVVRYIQDIVVFLRLSRAVGGGVSAKANFQLARFAKSVDCIFLIFLGAPVSLKPSNRFLAPLHGIDYLTPSIVALAARKVFRHRIIVTAPGHDRSLQYGSDLAAVSQVLADVNPDTILDGVLELEPPI
jgi:MoxR-like ATPase